LDLDPLQLFLSCFGHVVILTICHDSVLFSAVHFGLVYKKKVVNIN
jgi:hypothetical protein